MVIDFSKLKDLRKSEKGKIVLGLGTFDLFHYEHLRYLQAAKEQGDILVVAVKDNYCSGLKGYNRPIVDELYRLPIVDNIKCVDYVFLVNYDMDFDTSIEYDNIDQLQWLRIFEKVFRDLRPDVLYYENNQKLQSVRERVFAAYNVTGVSRERTALICTSSIVEKIKNDRD